MLLPQIQITQPEADVLVIKDITPDYSPYETNGYGVVNVEAEEIVTSEINLDFGNGMAYSLTSTYNRTKGEWEIHAYDLPELPITTSSTGCNDCGSVEQPKGKFGHLSAFPQGCVLITYEVFSADSNAPNNRKSEGKKVLKFVSTFLTEKKLHELAERIPFPTQGGVSRFWKNRDERREIMNFFGLANLKLDLLQIETGCDCECIASRIKQIDAYLSRVENGS
jgi:hypothetical protein